jgi:hypothetical protein
MHTSTISAPHFICRYDARAKPIFQLLAWPMAHDKPLAQPGSEKLELDVYRMCGRI